MMRRFSAVASVLETDDLDTVADRLTLHDTGAVVVLSTAGRLVGIITDGDLVKTYSRRKAELSELKAEDIMNPDVHTCRSDESELEILTVMAEKQIRHMAVMLGENVVGLVTIDEAVRHRLLKLRQLTVQAHSEPNAVKRLALVDQHIRENWSIFEVFRVVSAVQEQTGLANLDDRAKQLLWVIGDADSEGRQLQIKDLMFGNRLGTFPTVRRNLDVLLEKGFVESAESSDLRSKRFRLSQRGCEAFAQMTRAVANTIMPLPTAS